MVSLEWDVSDAGSRNDFSYLRLPDRGSGISISWDVDRSEMILTDSEIR